MGTQNKCALKRAQKWVRFSLMAIAILSMLFVPADLTNGMPSLSSVARHNGNLHSVHTTDPLYPTDGQNYLYRGDWEIPDILLMVENEEWQESLDVIASAALQDGIPAFILTTRYENDEHHPAEQSVKQSRVLPLMFSYDTPWIRDYGPVQLTSSGNSVYWMDFGYAEDRPRDDSVPQQLAEYMKLPIMQGGYYLEGGGIISNGRGLCAVTDESLDKSMVNISIPEEGASFRKALGCTALAVMPALTGESTGHADIIAQFLSPETVAVSSLNPDVSYQISLELDKAVESLSSAARSVGQRLRIIRVPMYVDGSDFYSYVNGTRLRHSYLMPSFKNVPTEMEKAAYRAVGSALGRIKLVPVPADTMVLSGGAVHCITLGLGLPRAAGPLYLRTENEGANLLKGLFARMRENSIRNLNK
jgi:agmatine/peptidylarginine deiminase